MLSSDASIGKLELLEANVFIDEMFDLVDFTEFTEEIVC
jgi:hypothetical protein